MNFLQKKANTFKEGHTGPGKKSIFKERVYSFKRNEANLLKVKDCRLRIQR